MERICGILLSEVTVGTKADLTKGKLPAKQSPEMTEGCLKLLVHVHWGKQII